MYNQITKLSTRRRDEKYFNTNCSNVIYGGMSNTRGKNKRVLFQKLRGSQSKNCRMQEVGDIQ